MEPGTVGSPPSTPVRPVSRPKSTYSQDADGKDAPTEDATLSPNAEFGKTESRTFASASPLSKAAAKAAGTQTRPAMRRFYIPAHFSAREVKRSKLRPAASEVHFARCPARAASVHAPVMFQHQALASRCTPHPYDGAQRRWPASGPVAQGIPETLDHARNTYCFGARQQRWAQHWLPKTEELGEAPEATVDELMQFLAKRFGTLRAAFDHLDFFQDGQLSLLEWQEGLFNLLYSSYEQMFGRKSSKMASFHLSKLPKAVFNRRMQRLFAQIDIDGDGFIDFFEMVEAKGRPQESPKEFTARRLEEQIASEPTSPIGSCTARLTKEHFLERILELGPKDFAVSTDHFGGELTSIPKKGTEALQDNVAVDGSVSGCLQNFSTLLLHLFPNLDAAFKNFDTSGTGRLSSMEFRAGCRSMNFAGSWEPVFKELDSNHDGIISREEFFQLRLMPQRLDLRVSMLKLPTKACAMQERRQSNKPDARILHPPEHQRGSQREILGLESSSAAGFHTFARHPTRRLNLDYHPQEFPGTDPEVFSKDHGPGFRERGPRYHPDIGERDHPLRGRSWQMGHTLNKVERFGPMIPSHEGGQDTENAADTWAQYHSSAPRDQWHICETGKTSMRDRRARVGPTFGTAESFGLMAPTPIGPWRDSKIGLSLRSSSTPSLLKMTC